MSGYMYILLCSNGSYYTGSTVDLQIRLQEHIAGQGANHTRKYPPQALLYIEHYPSIQLAFRREKQVQGWSRKKKEALIEGNEELLHKEAECKNVSHYALYLKPNDPGTTLNSGPSAPLRDLADGG